MELFVFGFADAFWPIPLLPAERKFFVEALRSRWLVFLRATQGPRRATLLWGRAAALISRVTQGALVQHKARLNCYVDDSIVAVAGREEERRQYMAMVIYL